MTVVYRIRPAEPSALPLLTVYADESTDSITQISIPSWRAADETAAGIQRAWQESGSAQTVTALKEWVLTTYGATYVVAGPG